MIKTFADKIRIEKAKNFDIKSILECGQVFRYIKYAENDYGVFSLDKYARVTQKGNSVEIFTDTPEYFCNYFDLDRDYEKICRTVTVNEIMSQAVEHGKGIRILNQDLTETLFSFILSSNNNIKRIQKIIECLCSTLGEKTKYGYAFPTVEALASQSKLFYCESGCGYRADYIFKTAKKLTEGFDLDALKTMSTAEARKKLMSLDGVGGKVADCILLFGLRRTDVFPVDTWIEKVYENHFSNGNKLAPQKISEFFIQKFGENSGYAQQYLFYFERESIAKH
ncbi:MAG TPA: DNA glycosylase [Clostridia bacterium]|nr:DNA glycosylase [Clostridia bacterium]